MLPLIMDAKDLKQIRELIKTEFDIHDEKWEKKIFDWKSEIMDSVDGLAKEVRDNREFREILSHQTTENTRRIEKLENKVFGSAQIGV